MRLLGVATTHFVLYLLFVAATVSVLLSVILAILWALVWRGLGFPVGPREIAFVLLGGGVLAALGYAVWIFANRRWARRIRKF